jgi:hypothetical protein
VQVSRHKSRSLSEKCVENTTIPFRTHTHYPPSLLRRACICRKPVKFIVGTKGSIWKKAEDSAFFSP